MSPSNRFDKLLKTAKPAAQPQPPDVQTSEHSDVQEPKTKPSREAKTSNIQTSEHSDAQMSKAKSSSQDFKRTTLYLTQDLHRKLKRASLAHDMEMSDIAEAAITQWLEEHSLDQG